MLQRDDSVRAIGEIYDALGGNYCLRSHVDLSSIVRICKQPKYFDELPSVHKLCSADITLTVVD